MNTAELQPDIALKALLEGNVKVKASNGRMIPLKVFADGEHGNKDADDEYIEILFNGNPRDITYDRTLWQGNLAIYLRCKTQTDTRVKRSRMQLLLLQIEPLIDRRNSQGYFFKLSAQPITPPQRDYTSGYASAVYNVEWRFNALEKTRNLITLKTI